MMPDFIPLEEFMGGAAQAQGGLVPLEEFGGTVAQENPANYAMRVFQAKGWSREQAAGMVGNLLHESNLHPEAVGDGGASFGIAQWNGARRKGLEAFAAARGAAVNDFNTQLDYVHHELENTEVAAGQALKNTGDVDSAVNIFSEKYERPGVPRLESRLAHARRTYDPEKYKYGDFLDVAGAADVGPGLYQGKPPRREPGIYAEDRSLLDRAKDYLGYKDMPEFLPVFNRDNQQWEAKSLYEARKLFHGWDEPTELERVLGRGLSALTLGGADYLAEDITGRVGGMARPETVAGTVAGAGLELGGFLLSPYKMSQMLIGGRLAPTRAGLRGMAELMREGGATLGLATGISSLIPTFMQDENLTEKTWQFVKGMGSGTLVGMLFPVLGARGEKYPNPLRLAAGLAVMDFVRTRFHEAPDKGLFTFDDVVRGVLDGSIDPKVLAQKSFDYLMDLYFIGKTPSMKRSFVSLRINKIMSEAAKASPQEAEELLVDIGAAGAPGTPKWEKMVKEEMARLAAEESRGQGPGARGQEMPPSPQPSPPGGEGGREAQAGKSGASEEISPAEGAAASPQAGVPPSPADAAALEAGLGRGQVAGETPALPGEGVEGVQAGTPAPPELPAWAQEIEVGDPIRDRHMTQIGGEVIKEVTQGKGKKAQDGYLVQLGEQQHFIPKENAELMGGPEQKFAMHQEERGPGKMYGGGPGTEEVVALGKDMAGLGAKVIDWFDKRLERNLPPELRDKDASKNLGAILLKFQQWEDVGRTYPEMKPVFEGAREGVAVKMRLAQEFAGLMAPYSTRLNPEERGRVDKVLVERDVLNSPAAGREFRLGNDIDVWRQYLLNPREEVREKGIVYFEGLGLSPKEAEGAFGARMALDYARADIMDRHTLVFQEWAAAHGLDEGKVKDLIDWTLNTKHKIEEVAKIYFGEEPGKGVPQVLQKFREAMQYWLKEAHEYIPRSRYGDFFMRVYAKESELTGKARQFLQKVEEFFPGGLEAARQPENWPVNKKGKLEVPGGIRMSYAWMKKALEMEAGENVGREVKVWKGPQGHRLIEVAENRAAGELVHVEAAEGRGQYQEKMARLRAEFPEGEFEIGSRLEKKDPMEIFAETYIPRVWRIITEAQKSRKMPLEVKAAEIEAWQDFLAAKGFGSHYIGRSGKVITGYETDLMRPLADYLAGQAGYAGKMVKIRRFSEAFPNFENTPELLRHANEYSNYVLSNPYEFQGIRKLIYNLTLGGNLSFYLINGLQNISTGWAVLGQVSKAPAKELGGALKDWVKHLTTGKGLRPGEEAVLARARYEPELQPTGAEELSGRAYNPLYRWRHNDPTSIVNKGMDWVKEFWYGSGVEKFNRETFFLAAYRATGEFEQAIDLTRQAHFLYGKETRPELGRGIGALPATFLTYSLNYITLLKNFSKAVAGVNPETYGTRTEGAQGLARMAAGAFLAGGLTGYGPVWMVMKWAWRKVFGSDLEEDGKNYLAEDLGLGKAGEFAGRAVFRGLPSAALGWDIGARVAPNLPFMNLPQGTVRWQDIVAGGLGAATIPLQRLFGAGAALGEGQYGRMVEQIMPVSVASLMQQHRLGTEGATTLKGRPLFTKEGEPLILTPWERISKGAGFQPVRVAERYAMEQHARAMEADKRDRAQNIAGDLARAIKAKDEAGFRETVQGWVEHNNKMLKKGRLADVITPESVEAAVMNRFKPKVPDVSEKQMLLRQMGREAARERSLAEVVGTD